MLELRNKFTVLSEYSGNTKFDFWKQLKPKDTIEIYIVIKDPGRYRKKLYATEVCVDHKDKTFKCSLTQLYNYLSKIEIK